MSFRIRGLIALALALAVIPAQAIAQSVGRITSPKEEFGHKLGTASR